MGVMEVKMDTRYQKRDGRSSTTRRSSVTAEIRQVQNVALADATAKAGVSPWTRAMFKVRMLVLKLHITMTSNMDASSIFASSSPP